MAKDTDVIAVFTFRTKAEIIQEGGSQAWALSPSNARRCKFLVCTRNRYTHPGEAGLEEHGAAFLVGKISTIDAAPERPDRFIIRFSEYALLDPQPVVWPGSRNPVWYVDALADLKIDEGALVWQPVVDDAEAETPPSSVSAAGFTDEDIRRAVARAHKVKPEQVTITITL